MTQDEIIEMARQAGFLYGKMGPSDMPFVTAIGHTFIVELEIFAKLVAQHERDRIIASNELVIERVNEHIQHLHYAVQAEREACAIACETDGRDLAGLYYAGVIRARGEA